MLFRYLIVAALAYWLIKLLRGPPKQRKAPTSSSAQDPYTVLGVNPGASKDEIQQAYQALVRQYHPDKVMDMGPEVRQVAEQKTKEINEAYGALKTKWKN